MKRYLLATLAGIVMLITPATASASPIRECGNVNSAGVSNITTRHLSCHEARAFVRSYVHGYAPNMAETRHYHAGYVDIRLVRYSSVLRFQLAQD